MLTNLRNHLYRSRFPGWIDGFDHTKSIFIHIPKCAGTTISEALYGADPWHYTALHYKENAPRRFRRYFTFAIVRDPLDRLISTYHYSFEQTRRWPTTSVAFITRYLTLEEFILDWLTPEAAASHYFLKPQCEYLFDCDDNLLVDYIGYFCDLPTVLPFLADRVGYKGRFEPKNVGLRRKADTHIGSEARERVRRVYDRDYRLLDFNI
jgi:chondroitin 4-sulfotransferase 11